MAHTFLSDEWLEAVGQASAELGSASASDIVVNVTVTGGPQGDRQLHLDGGTIAGGHVEAPTKLILPYAVARKMFVEGDQQAAMQAFMTGQIKIDGDMSKVMALQSSGGGSPQLQARVRELTAD